MEDQERAAAPDDSEDVEAHKAKKTVMASDKPTDEAEGEDVEAHRAKHQNY